jgi:hypothetical protein
LTMEEIRKRNPVDAEGYENFIAATKAIFDKGFVELADPTRKTSFPGYRMFNEDDLREAIAVKASQRYGYDVNQIRFALFVLVPLAEVAPDWRHPVLGLTAAEMLQALPPGQRIQPLGEGEAASVAADPPVR